MQMVFGLSLSLFNHLYFNNSLSLFFEFIPQIIFITLIFVYLCVMIFIKWIKYEGSSDSLYGSNCAPNLLIELINMFFLSTTATPEHECYALYPGQVISLDFSI
jgi:V-type H+-transporting ATPase subunit a